MTNERAMPTVLRQRSPTWSLGPSVKPIPLNRSTSSIKELAELILCSLPANARHARYGTHHSEENRCDLVRNAQKIDHTSSADWAIWNNGANKADNPRPVARCHRNLGLPLAAKYQYRQQRRSWAFRTMSRMVAGRSGMSRRRNRPTGPDDTHDGGPEQPARHPAGPSHHCWRTFTGAGLC